jgi:tetratricopeptide (TPR) repeat protein
MNLVWSLSQSFFVICALFLTQGALASTSETLEKAEKAYDSGNYVDSVAAYETIISEGYADRDVLYNLGHAYHRLNQVGASLAAFLAARELAPRDPDVQANIKFLTGNLLDKLEVEVEPPTLLQVFFWVRYVSVRELGYASAWATALLGLCLGLAWKRRVFKVVAIPVAVVVGVLFASTLVKHWLEPTWGAVTAAKVDVLSGPSPQNPVLFSLRAGAPVMVEEERNGWYKLALSDGKRGWLDGKSMKVYLWKP